VPGIVLGVEIDGARDVVADGVADLATAEPVRRETSFRVASITKPFVAALADALADDGLLALDEPLAAGATPRQLLSHQGGLASEWPSSLEAYGDDDAALARLATDEPARLPVGPGELFSYSNAGYWLVGAAIARATGRTFEAAMRDRVLRPLDLGRTDFAPSDPAARGHEQVAPEAGEHRGAEGAYPRVRHPSGGLWATVDDLLDVAALLADRTALHEPLVGTPDGGYGLGVALRTANGRRIVEHAGSAAGFQSLLLLVPDERLAFAALTNSSRGRRVIRSVLELLGLYASPEPYRLPGEDLAELVGRYGDDWMDVRVRAEGGGLVLETVWTDVFTDERLSVAPVRAEATSSTSRAPVWAASAGSSPPASRSDRRRRGRPPGDRRRRDRGPRGRRDGGRRRRGGVARLVRRRDGHDRAPRRGACDLLGRR
jgi:CubicO group peptidase (beta-lactamase class C family)